jgi:hypothetical protein
MVLSILFIFFLIVIIIGLATARLNAKVPCEHHWVETEEGHIKCAKCYRMIRHFHDEGNAETEIGLINIQINADSRPEGVKISPQALTEAS